MLSGEGAVRRRPPAEAEIPPGKKFRMPRRGAFTSDAGTENYSQNRLTGAEVKIQYIIKKCNI